VIMGGSATTPAYKMVVMSIPTYKEEIFVDYEECIALQVRKDWFGQHTYRMSEHNGTTVIDWFQPGTGNYYAKYILSGNNVFVAGDIGEAVYTLTGVATIEEMKMFDLFYFTGKLSAFKDSPWNFDSSYAREQFEEFWASYGMDEEADAEDVKLQILNVMDESGTQDELKYRLLSLGEEIELDYEILDFGKRLSRRIIGYWVGLQMIAEQIERDKSAEVAPVSIPTQE